MEEDTEEEEEEVEAYKEEVVVPLKQKGWGSNSGLRPLMSFWERRGNTEVTKYASESHLADDRVPENGLRRQVREKDFTSGESSAEEGWEEHIYARIEEPRPALVEESGFFSHEEPREEIFGSEEDEFVLVGGGSGEPRHIQRLTVGGEERHVTRIQVQAFKPGFGALEEKRRKVEKEEEERRNIEELERIQLEKERLQFEEQQRQRQERMYKERQLKQREEERRQKKDENRWKREEQTDQPRQSVRDLRALYERVGTAFTNCHLHAFHLLPY